jgi:hypothetical protein
MGFPAGAPAPAATPLTAQTTGNRRTRIESSFVLGSNAAWNASSMALSIAVKRSGRLRVAYATDFRLSNRTVGWFMAVLPRHFQQFHGALAHWQPARAGEFYAADAGVRLPEIWRGPAPCGMK